MQIDESLTAKGYTPAAQVPQVFGQARKVKSITIHWWGSYGQTHDGVCNFFVNGAGATSAHYVASDGRVSCLVNPDDAAWHSGTAEGNATSIGIECRPEATDGDYATVAELIAYLRGIYGDIPLYPHNHWYATACPGDYDLDRLDSLARGTTISTQSATINPVQEDDMATVPQDEWEWAKQVLTALSDNAATKKDLKGIWKEPIDWRNPATGELVPGATTPETVLSYVDTNTARVIDAKSVVASIPDNLAQEVLDLLAARLGGK